jgi:amidase
MTADICFMTAIDLARALRARELSAVEVMQAHLQQIEAVNPEVNAIVTLTAETALAEAKAADQRLARGEAAGPLHGLPVAHKDLFPTRGVRTTFGSPAYRDYVPDADALPVERLKLAGAITVGKTNTPEFGAGGQTFNAVFGATLNPYDPTRTCGGSSGGAAVALACGMVPLADGTDLGGSLRNPANFCNVVGLRPSPGRVPTWPDQLAWYPFTVAGPMARTVADCALLLSVLAGPDDRSPIALETPGSAFAAPLERDFRGVRVAWSRDLGGLPVDPRVAEVLQGQRDVFEQLGCRVEEAEPDLADADEVFRLWRAWRMELRVGDLLDRRRELLKEAVIWNAEQGRAISGPQLARAEARHTALYHRMREFMRRHEFLVLPVNSVPPFPVTQEYPPEIAGVPSATYIDWMKTCYFITVTGHPAISVPCGFTGEGLPVGIQIVGRHRDDFGVLQLAHAFEQATGVGRRRPPLAALKVPAPLC